MKKFLVVLMKFFSFVAVMLIVFGGSAYCGYLYITPSSIISLIGNPSIKYSVNSFNRVISVETDSSSNEVNGLINGLKLNNKNISDAVQSTLDELVEGGYISQYNNSVFTLSISNEDEDKANSLVNKLKQDVQEYLDKNEEIENAKVETIVNVTRNTGE